MSRRVSLPGRLLGAAPEFMLLEDDEDLCLFQYPQVGSWLVKLWLTPADNVV